MNKLDESDMKEGHHVKCECLMMPSLCHSACGSVVNALLVQSSKAGSFVQVRKKNVSSDGDLSG